MSTWTRSPTRTASKPTTPSAEPSDRAGTDRSTPSASSRIEPGPLSRHAPVQVSAPASAPVERGRRGRPGVVRDRGPLGPVVRRPDPVERVGPRGAVADDRLADQPAQEPQVRHEPQDDGLVERRRQPVERLGARRAPGDDLGEHRVEAAADLGPELDPGIDPDAVARRPAEPLDPAGLRAGTRPRRPRRRGGPRRRGPWRSTSSCVEPERLARRDPELVGDEVAAR